MTLKKAVVAAIAVLTAVAAIDESNIVGQIARKAIELLTLAFGA